MTDRWELVKRLVCDALERPAGQRAAFLDAACADPDLRREVDELLAADARAGDFLAAPASLSATSGEESATLRLPKLCLRCGARYSSSCDACSRDGADLVDDPAALVNTTLDGTYDVVGLLGAGGMGEVYLATDTTLRRPVALKLLPASVSRDAGSLRRFEVEARAAAKLSHPNVCMVYELGRTDDGRHFIAMEYVEGRTLRSRLSRGALGLGEALDVARQVARALAAAHASGVVHRDVKPENVMLRPDGYVKVLDFGLAKLTEMAAPEAGAGAGGASETATRGAVGTLGFMSPEQATGRRVDARSDVFSFGAVLYELLTGERAFAGATAAETVYATVHEEPAKLASLEGAVPAGVAEVVRRCLEKAPERRYESGAALAAALDELVERLRSSGASAVAPAPTLWRWSLALAVALTLAVGGAWVWRASSQADLESRAASGPPLRPMKVSRLTNFQGVASFPKFSPDGKQIAFGGSFAGSPSNSDIYVKDLDSGAERRLTSDANRDVAVSWSPDGQTIAFLRWLEDKQALMTVPVDGGPERLLITTNHFVPWKTTDWSPNGDLIAYSDCAEPGDPWGIFLVNAATSETRQLTFPPGRRFADYAGDWCAAFSPDGQSVAFARAVGPMTADLYVVAVAGGEPRRLTFDNQHIMGVAWTPDGRSIVYGSGRAGACALWRIAAEGGEPEPLGPGSPGFFPAISRDGTRLAYVTAGFASTTWRVDLPERHGKPGPPAPLFSSTDYDEAMRYSPDGKRLAFASTRSGATRLWVCDGDGSNAAQVPGVDHAVYFPPAWSPDGRFLVFEATPEGNPDVYVVGVEGGTPRRLTDDPAADLPRAWSHDGRWIYFLSNRSGSMQLWKMSPEGGDAVQLTRDGGTSAFEPRDTGYPGVDRMRDGGTSVFESSDWRYVYFHKGRGGPGLWRIPAEGGEEELVWDEHGADLGDRWVLADDGVYFATRVGDQAIIEFYSFATRTRTRIASAPQVNGLALSPDGRRLLYWTLDQFDYNIFLVENVRL